VFKTPSIFAILVLINSYRDLKIQCVGKFACPGYFSGHTGYYKDLDKRPSERDLMKAQIFLEEVIEDNYINGQD